MMAGARLAFPGAMDAGRAANRTIARELNVTHKMADGKRECAKPDEHGGKHESFRSYSLREHCGFWLDDGWPGGKDVNLGALSATINARLDYRDGAEGDILVWLSLSDRIELIADFNVSHSHARELVKVLSEAIEFLDNGQ